MKEMCPAGRKCAYIKWIMSAAFAVITMTVMSVLGAPSTQAQAQSVSPQSKCLAPSPGSDTEASIEESVLPGPVTLGFGSSIGFFRDGGYATIMSILNPTSVVTVPLTPSPDQTQKSRGDVYALNSSKDQSSPCSNVAVKQ
jgi:hypothetical protein